MSKTKEILLYFVRFITASLFFIIGCLMIVGSVLTEKNVYKIMSKTEYSDKLSVIIRENMEGLTASANVPYSVLDGIITSETLTQDLKNILHSFYEETAKPDATQIKEKLDANIRAYLESQNIKSINEEDLNRFISNIAESYEEEVNVYGYLDFVKSISRKVADVLPYLIVILVSLEVCLVLVLKLVFKENRLSYIWFTSSFLFIVVFLFLMFKLSISDIFIFQSAFSILIQSIIRKVLVEFVLTGILLLLIGFLSELNLKEIMSRK